MPIHYYYEYKEDKPVDKQEMFNQIESCLLQLRQEEILTSNKFHELQFKAIHLFTHLPKDDFVSPEVANEWMRKMATNIELELLKH